MGGGGIMIWAAISYNKKSKLLFVDGTMYAAVYVKVLDDGLGEWMDQFRCKNLIFQQDNAAVHTKVRFIFIKSPKKMSNILN